MGELDYKPNSHKYKEGGSEAPNDRKMEKVVTGAVKTRKKNEIRKLTDVFISEDAANVKSYIVMDVLIPSIKKAISDIVTNGIDMILYGETRGKKGGSSGSKISYRNYYERSDDRSRRDDSRVRNIFDYDDIVIETRGDAEMVLDRMEEALERYKMVSVADLYDAVNITAPYTSNKYGWCDLEVFRSVARVVPVRDGYMLKLPKAMPID